MEPSNRRSLIDEHDVNISTFRRRNKIIAAGFTLLIISLTLLITASLTQIRTNNKPSAIPPLLEFCSVNYSPRCLRTFNPIITGKSITDPNQILAISLQTAAHIIDTSLAHTPSNNCSKLLRHGSGRVRESLETMRVNPFVEFLSDQQRDEMMNWIAAAEDDVRSCLDDLAEVSETTAKLVDATKYLTGAFDFVDGHGKRGRIAFVAEENDFYRRVISENLFVCSLQLLFIVGLFCSLFRTR